MAEVQVQVRYFRLQLVRDLFSQQAEKLVKIENKEADTATFNLRTICYYLYMPGIEIQSQSNLNSDLSRAMGSKLLTKIITKVTQGG